MGSYLTGSVVEMLLGNKPSVLRGGPPFCGKAKHTCSLKHQKNVWGDSIWDFCRVLRKLRLLVRHSEKPVDLYLKDLM